MLPILPASVLVIAMVCAPAALGAADTALEFDGSDDFVTFGDVSEFDFGTQPFTIELWLNKPDTRREAIITKRTGCDHNSFWSIRYMPTDGNLGLEINGEQCVNGPTIVAQGNWHHVAFTRSGDTIRTYLDGQLYATDQHATFAGSIGNGSPMLIGDGPCVGFDTTHAFSGMIDDVMI